MAGGFFDGLEEKITSPLFLAGAGLLSGEGFGGAMEGLKMGTGLKAQRRKQQEDMQRQQAFQQLTAPGALNGVSPDVMKLAQAAGPDAGFGMLAGAMPKPRDALEEEYKRAQIGALNRRGTEGQASKPANVAEWEYYNSLSKPDQLRYNAMKRGEQWKNTGTEFTNAGDPSQTMPINNAGKAAQEVIGKAQGGANVDMPKSIQTASQILGQLQSLEQDPALNRMVGPLAGRLPNVSADSERVQSKIDQTTGAAFLTAFESLKGAGQITEIEGQKATAAITRLQNQRLSPSDYRQAIKELKAIVRNGLRRAEVMAGRRPESDLQNLEVFGDEKVQVAPSQSGGGWGYVGPAD
jgi:hypothetical protein